MPELDSKKGPFSEGIIHERHAKKREIVRDVMGGTLVMRDKSSTYLPPFENEEGPDYKRRVNRSVLYNAGKRTVKGLTGMVFRKDVTFPEEIGDEYEADWTDIDRAGRHGTIFAADLFEEALQDGVAFIFVDMPVVEVERIRRADREVMPRPYWNIIRADNLLAFNYKVVNGEVVITKIRFREEEIVEDGEFGEKEIERARQYVLVEDEEGMGTVEYRVWEREKGKPKTQRETTPDSNRFRNMTRIPIAPCYTNRIGVMEAEPPLLDLFHENVRHFQVMSDNDNIEHASKVPIWVTVGAKDTKVQGFGPGIGLNLPAGAEADWKVADPAGAETGKKTLQESERRMAAQGLAMLQPDTRMAETAEAKRIEKSETDSVLAKAARSCQEALDLAWSFHAEFVGDLDNAPTTKVNDDFEARALTAEEVKVLLSMIGRDLSWETVMQRLVEGEWLSPDFDMEAEKDALESGSLNGVAQLLASAAGRRQLPADGGTERTAA